MRKSLGELRRLSGALDALVSSPEFEAVQAAAAEARDAAGMAVAFGRFESLLLAAHDAALEDYKMARLTAEAGR